MGTRGGTGGRRGAHGDTWDIGRHRGTQRAQGGKQSHTGTQACTGEEHGGGGGGGTGWLLEAQTDLGGLKGTVRHRRAQEGTAGNKVIRGGGGGCVQGGKLSVHHSAGLLLIIEYQKGERGGPSK
jgi:hypothetical protein